MISPSVPDRAHISQKRNKHIRIGKPRATGSGPIKAAAPDFSVGTGSIAPDRAPTLFSRPSRLRSSQPARIGNAHLCMLHVVTRLRGVLAEKRAGAGRGRTKGASIVVRAGPCFARLMPVGVYIRGRGAFHFPPVFPSPHARGVPPTASPPRRSGASMLPHFACGVWCWVVGGMWCSG